jgi:hypothetical protein
MERTLLLGLSLPHVSFDNATFVNGPSLSEYSRVVVDTAAAARAVQDIVDGNSVATTFGGQAVVNGPSSAYAFPLTELLAMRRRESERLLAAGGLMVLTGHPVSAISGIHGLDAWSSHSWLPDPNDLPYADLLQPGFGREGAAVTDADHPFAPFVSQLATRIGYRATANEDHPRFPEIAHVFARSSGGAAIAFDLRVAGGTIVVLPALNNPDRDREQITAALIESFERRDGASSQSQAKTTGVSDDR